MILELVRFKSPAGWDRAHTVEHAKETVAEWVANRDLVRKYFFKGFGETLGTGGGVYIWPSIEAAKKAHNEKWCEGVKQWTGDYPTIRYYDLFLLVDNEQGRVTEWAEDGTARELAAA